LPLPEAAQAEAMPAEALGAWWHHFGLMNRGALRAEVERSKAGLMAGADEHAAARHVRLVSALRAADRGEPDETEM
jgi:hypothetical protein